jgi:hypothetical protein
VLSGSLYKWIQVSVCLFNYYCLSGYFAEYIHFPISAESPGVLFISQAFAAFDEQTYSAAFGGIGVTMIDSTFEFYRPRVTQEQEADK